MFALNHARPGSRILPDDVGDGRVAFAFRREAGGAAELADFTSSEEGVKIDDGTIHLHALVGQRRRA